MRGREQIRSVRWGLQALGDVVCVYITNVHSPPHTACERMTGRTGPAGLDLLYVDGLTGLTASHYQQLSSSSTSLHETSDACLCTLLTHL